MSTVFTVSIGVRGVDNSGREAKSDAFMASEMPGEQKPQQD